MLRQSVKFKVDLKFNLNLKVMLRLKKCFGINVRLRVKLRG